MLNRKLAWIGIVGALGAGTGCGAGKEERGAVQLAVSKVPDDARCLKVVATGSRTVTTLLDLTPAQEATFTLTRLPIGTVQFSGEAYAAVCSAVTAATTPAWLADPVNALLTAGEVAKVSLLLRRNGRAMVTAEFEQEDGGPPPVDAAPPADAAPDLSPPDATLADVAEPADAVPADGGAPDGAASDSASPAVTTLEVRLLANEDDAEEDLAAGTVDITSSDLEMTRDVGLKRDQAVGIRFQNVTIPQGATITNAYVQFWVKEVIAQSSDPASLFITGEASDNAAVFSAAPHNVTGRALTTAQASWSDIPAWNTVGVAGPEQRTVNLAAVVQEIVSRAGWAPGNALALIVTTNGPHPYRSAVSRNNSLGAAQAPVLHVEYTSN